MEKIITTGLTGLVGSQVRDRLLNRYQFINLSLPEDDILDYKKIKRVFREHSDARLVLHLAAFTDVNKAWEERGNKGGACYRVNVLGTKNIAELCLEFHKHLIYVSTDFVFNGQKRGVYTEEDEPDPLEWYGETKFLAEKGIQRIVPSWSIIRLAFPYRANYPGKIDLVRRIIEMYRNKTLPPMFTDQITTPTFVDDIVMGLEAMFVRRPQGLYHLVGSSFQSPYELAEMIAEVFQLNKSLLKKGSLAQYAAAQPKDARPWHKNLALSNQKARIELGIKMSTLQEGLEKMKAQMN